jgi:hypothetical protein
MDNKTKILEEFIGNLRIDDIEFIIKDRNLGLYQEETIASICDLYTVITNGTNNIKMSNKSLRISKIFIGSLNYDIIQGIINKYDMEYSVITVFTALENLYECLEIL